MGCEGSRAGAQGRLFPSLRPALCDNRYFRSAERGASVVRGLGKFGRGFLFLFFCEQRALFFTFPLQVCMSRFTCWLLTISALCFSSVTDISLNSPNKGLLSDAMMDVPVDSAAAARTATPEGLSAAEEEELRAEIAKVKPHLSPGSCPAGRERPGFGGRCRSGAWAFWILMVMLPGGLCVLC